MLTTQQSDLLVCNSSLLQATAYFYREWNAQSGAEDCISRSNFATQKSLHFNISNFQVNSQADEKQQLVGKERPYVHH